MKKIIVIIFGVAIYIWGLVHGYVSPMWGGWMFATALLYMMMHYVTLSWRDTVHKYGRAIWVFIAAITLFILGFTKNIWLGLSVLLWHAAIRSVVHSLEDILTNRRKFHFQEFFQAGSVMFSIFFTLSFITAFMGRNQQFTLTCDDITKASTAVLSYTQDKFNIGVHQIDERQRDILGNMISGATEEHESNSEMQNIEGMNIDLDTLSGFDTTSFG